MAVRVGPHHSGNCLSSPVLSGRLKLMRCGFVPSYRPHSALSFPQSGLKLLSGQPAREIEPPFANWPGLAPLYA